MARFYRMLLTGLLALCLPLALTGCIFKSIDELYAVPKLSSNYYNLGDAINQTITGDMQYAAPASGMNQQAIQLADLDGDGTNEALAFVRATGDRPMKVFLYKRIASRYEMIGAIECDGSSFESVEYLQLDDQPGLEVVLCFQVSNQVPQAIGVWTLRGDAISGLMNSAYSEYTIADLDQDGISELCLIRQEQEGGNVDYYDLDSQGNLVCMDSAPLSAGIGMIRRIITGDVDEGVKGVFVASSYGNADMVTDIFAIRNGSFQNISIENGSDVSTQTVRNYMVYAADVDGDQLIELPSPRRLRSPNESEEPFWVITWYNMTLSGHISEKMTTFHNYPAGWYFVLPEQWGRSVTISRSEPVHGVSGYVFSQWDDREKAPVEIFTLYAFTGDDRTVLATSDGRFIVGETGDVTYSASFGTADWAEKLTQGEVVSRFHYIHVDWNTGEM